MSCARRSRRSTEGEDDPLRGDRLDEEQKDHLIADIEQESERLFRMVEDLRALARVELGQTSTTEPLLMQRTIEKVAAAFGQRKPGRLLELNIEQDLPPVAAQHLYVEQVLGNLLSNADKYSPSGSPINTRHSLGRWRGGDRPRPGTGHRRGRD
jgi:two-component system sensor histidine kinase KdpD